MIACIVLSYAMRCSGIEGSFEQMYPIRRHKNVFIVANYYQKYRLQSIQFSHSELYQYFVRNFQTPEYISPQSK